MDETDIEVAIQYDVKNGRVVLSGLEPPVVAKIKKKLASRRKVTMQLHDDGFIVSPEGVYFAADDPPKYRIGVA